MSNDDSCLSKDLIANLEEIGIGTENINFAHVTMHSESFICVRENKHPSKSSLKIIDLRHGIEISDKSMTADSAIMNPENPHLALRAKNTIQVFNIDSKAKIASLQIDFEVIFWDWIDKNTMLLLSENGAYRWDYASTDSVPLKWFDKSSSLDDCQIISAETDISGHWCFVSGISLKNGRICGTIQLFNENKRLSQVIEGHSGNFFVLNSNDSYEYSLFAFAVRNGATEMKLHLIQIDADNSRSLFAKRVVDLSLIDVPDNDFPISVVYDSKISLIFIYTKFGFVYSVEPYSGTCVFREKYCSSPLYRIVSSTDRTQQFILNRKGDIIRSCVNIENLFDISLRKGPDFYETTGVIMNCIDWKKQKKMYRSQFDSMKNSDRHLEALLLIAKSGKTFLRTFEYLSSIKDFPNLNETSALLEYFAIILEDGKLNEAESLELVQLALSKNKLEIVKKWLIGDKIFCTPQLGKVVLESDPELALEIFDKSGSESMSLYCLAVLGRFDEFSKRYEISKVEINVKEIFSILLKSKTEFVPKFLGLIFEAENTSIDIDFVNEIMEVDLEILANQIDEIFLNNIKVLFRLNSKEILTKFAIRLINSHPERISEYIQSLEEAGLEVCNQDILVPLKNANLFSEAFSFESNIDAIIELSDSIIGQESKIKRINLSHTDVKTLLFHLSEQNFSKYEILCAKLGEFISINDFDEVKQLFKQKMMNEQFFCDFLTFWSLNIKSNDLIEEILLSSIKLKDDDRMLKICEKLDFLKPQDAFKFISSYNYKCKPLKVLAARYDFHGEIIALFCSENDWNEAFKYIQIIGQDKLWDKIIVLLDFGIPEAFLKSLIDLPTDHKKIIDAGRRLEERKNIEIISPIFSSEFFFESSAEIMSFKAKILIQADDELFLKFIQDPKLKTFLENIMKFCEVNNPKMALKYYLLTEKLDDVVRLSFQLEEWDALILFLIKIKNYKYWFEIVDSEQFINIFPIIIKKSGDCFDPESASCLIKVLSAKNEHELLIQFASALLCNNLKLKNSRSLQTIYIINLIQNKPNEALEPILNLNNYNYEEVIYSAINHPRLDLALKVLEKFELWNYAFKIALYGKRDIELAKYFAQKSGHSEAWQALADFCLFLGNSDDAAKFAKKSGNFRRQKELIIFLHLNGKYEELLEFLTSMRSLVNFESIYEREIFFCLMKLERTDELDKFITTAVPPFANEIGKMLYREGSVEMAAKCFKQAENFDRATVCYLQLGHIDTAADLALKTENLDCWLDIIKFALNHDKFDLARKFALKCSQHSDRVESVLSIYEEMGAYENLIEIIEIILDSSAPQQQNISLMGEIFCRKFPEKLESFINKYYLTISPHFILIVSKYRRWKEAFKFLLLQSNLDDAVEQVIYHPSIEFDHRKLTAVIGKIKNRKVLDKLLDFYWEFNPRMLLELQDEFIDRLEMSTLIKFCKDKRIMFVLDKALRRYQSQNPTSVVISTGLNDLLIEINDYYGLIDSIKKCPLINAGTISEILQSSEHRHFRVLAAKLRANSGEFVNSLTILVEEDALIETLMILSQSSNVQYAEAVLARYSRIQNAVMFLAVSYVLFEFLRPDVIYELSHSSQFIELAMPLFCQIIRHKLK